VSVAPPANLLWAPRGLARSAEREALETAAAAAREETGSLRHTWALRAAEVAAMDAAEQRAWADKARRAAVPRQPAGCLRCQPLPSAESRPAAADTVVWPAGMKPRRRSKCCRNTMRVCSLWSKAAEDLLIWHAVTTAAAAKNVRRKRRPTPPPGQHGAAQQLLIIFDKIGITNRNTYIKLSSSYDKELLNNRKKKEEMIIFFSATTY